MKIVASIQHLLYRLIRREWITAKGCEPTPVLVVEDSRVFVLGRSLRVVKK